MGFASFLPLPAGVWSWGFFSLLLRDYSGLLALAHANLRLSPSLLWPCGPLSALGAWIHSQELV